MSHIAINIEGSLRVGGDMRTNQTQPVLVFLLLILREAGGPDGCQLSSACLKTCSAGLRRGFMLELTIVDKSSSYI